MTTGIAPFAEWIPGLRERTQDDPGGVWENGFRDRVGFCDHAAGGFFQTMRRPDFWHGMGTSVMFALGRRRGEIAQLVNIFDTAYAQGRLGPVVTWPRYDAIGRQNPNGFFVSTEHEDWELVNRVPRAIPGSSWTEDLYQNDLQVKRWAVEECGRQGIDILRFGLDSLAGHHMFDGVNRAGCPGSFWRNEYRARLYHDLTAPAAEGEDYMIRHNTISTALQGWSGQRLIRLEDFDAPPPATAKRLRLEVFNGGGRVIFWDGSGAYAGQSGWGGAAYVMIDVDLKDGAFAISEDGAIAQLGIVGYW